MTTTITVNDETAGGRRYVEVSYGEAYALDADGVLKSMEHAERSGDGFGNLYVVSEDTATLVPAEITTERTPFDEADYAWLRVSVNGEYIGSARIDGRS